MTAAGSEISMDGAPKPAYRLDRLFPQAVLDLLPLPAVICDASGGVIRLNGEAAALLGHMPARGEPWEAMLSDPAEGVAFQAALRGGEAIAGVGLGRAAHGHGARLKASAQPVFDGGMLAGTVVMFERDASGEGAVAGSLADILEALPAAIYTADTDGRITFYNRSAAQLWGCEPVVGQSLWCGSWKLYRPDGAVMPHEECPMAVAIRERRVVRGVETVIERPDGSRTAVMPHPTPLFDASGRFVGAINMLDDITHVKVADERHVLFARELNHRVKNALATVYAIAMQTLRHTDSTDVFRESFSGRLLALSRAHDLLVRSQWQETPLRTIVAEALSPFGSARLEVSGDESVAFGPRATLTLAMTFHELITNATRYGALSNTEGQVAIHWESSRDADGERVVELSWTESGGPAVEAPAATGFGSRLIAHNLLALGGSATTDYAPEGLQCRLRFQVIDELAGWSAVGARITPSPARPSDAPADPASPGGQVR